MNVPKLRFKEFTDEWQKKTLKSVSSYFKSGKSIKSNDILKNAPYPVYGGNGLRGYTNTFNFDGNASLIGRQGALCGNVTYVKGKNYMTEHAVIVQSNYDNYNKFLFYILLSMNLNQYSTQSAQPGLSVNNLLELFNYFPNIQEQNKIAKFLTTVDKKITNLENTITSLENQKKGLLQQIFSQKLRFKDKNSNNYPNWEKKKLGDTLLIQRGGSPRPISDYITNDKNGLNWIKIGDCSPNSNIITSTKEKIKPEGLSKTREVFIGDLILSNSMSFGRPYILNINGCIHDGWLLLRNTKKIYNLQFLCYILGSEYTTKQYKKLASGSTVNNLNIELVSSVDITIPCLEEQTKIADFLSAFDRKLENQKAQLEHWKQIKKGLLQQMFV
ncbi:restriction endonuclease subunit S [uncultured Megamonas sp.]|uniref:restriction endonuclease subunit S n=1 Tax=uncultured Megamonas sp. TaxID=286140 RepID=UPI002599E791|nr:restriction endonuclease subunit S [uncultured Megamonas sp.]